ncbi:MAG: HlyD family efflux transporter periplasmic adaptor subunit, partial [Rhodocyclaceae bacterium]|nr:HlyD family efflux transporter periplasmic adaptor subunit [Rhodocyclaceae bacterium]
MTRGRFGLLILGLLLAAGLIYGFMPRPVPVDVFTTVKGPLAVTVEEEAKTRVMERYVISAPMSGYLRRIDLKVGDAVEHDQVLAVLEPVRADALDARSRAQATAQVSAAEAALAAARENARAAGAADQLARQELQRIESLTAARFLSAQAADQARSNASRSQAVQQAAEHAVNVARFQLDTARVALAGTASLQSGAKAETLSVRAPVQARVLKLLRESEGTVRAGEPLLEVGNPETLEIAAEVLSNAAVRIAPGGRVLLDRWGGAPLQGIVRVVEPAGFTKISALGVEEQRVRVIVDVTSPREAWQRLGDGYRVEASFIVWEAGEVLQLPTSALFRHNNGWAVFAIAAGRARLQPVRIGERSGLRAQVLDGLQAGDLVIVHPDDKVRDGVRI